MTSINDLELLAKFTRDQSQDVAARGHSVRRKSACCLDSAQVISDDGSCSSIARSPSPCRYLAASFVTAAFRGPLKAPGPGTKRLLQFSTAQRLNRGRNDPT